MKVALFDFPDNPYYVSCVYGYHDLDLADLEALKNYISTLIKDKTKDRQRQLGLIDESLKKKPCSWIYSDDHDWFCGKPDGKDCPSNVYCYK